MRRTLLLALLISMAAACNSNPVVGSSELSRRTATQLINRYPAFASTQSISLVREGRLRSGTGQDAGVVEGLWTIHKEGRLFVQTSLILTEKGQKFFTRDWELVTPAKREVVEVTGISDAPAAQNIKEADFKWRYVDLPDVVARYTGQGKGLHSGKASFRLYDDGWRVVDVEVHETGRQPFVWTRSLEEEADRQVRAAQEAERAAQEAERARLESERKAKTPTRTIATYKTRCQATGEEHQLRITDTNVMVNGWSQPEIETIGYWELAVGRPSSWGGFCIEMEFKTPQGPMSGRQRKFLGAKDAMSTLNRAYDQITQAQKEWRQKYPDIH